MSCHTSDRNNVALITDGEIPEAKGGSVFSAERKHRQTEQIGKQSAMCNRAKQLRILRERRVQTLYTRAKRTDRISLSHGTMA